MLTFFFFNDTATTEIYTLSLHDALPILSEDTKRVMADVAVRLGDLGAAIRSLGNIEVVVSEIGRAHV